MEVKSGSFPKTKQLYPRGLFRGMSVNYMRAIPMTAISFSIYESMKQLMGLKTSLKISG